MSRLSQGTLVTAVVLWFCAIGVLPMTITGPSSAQSNGTVTFTWTSDSSDPTIFEIDIDELLNTLNQSDPYWIIQGLTTADGSATVSLPVLSVGTHRIAFASNDGFQILDEGSIEILPASSSSIPSSSALASSTSVSVPASKPPVSTSSSTSFTSSITPPSSSSQSSSTQSQTATSDAQKSSPSPAATSSLPDLSSPQTSPFPSTQSQNTTIGMQNGATKHHNNAGAIAGGVVGGAVVIILALLGWWYFRRRSGSTAAGGSHGDNSASPQFLVTPVSSALAGVGAVHNGSDTHEFRPWEANDTYAASSTTTPATASATTGTSTSSRKRPIITGVHPTQPDPGPSREALLEEVERLRQHIGAISPPAYSGE